MTPIAGIRVILIISHLAMLSVHPIPVVLVTGDAGKDAEIIRVGMADRTGFPPPPVAPTINGKPSPIVVKVGRAPAISGMARLASKRVASIAVFRIAGISIVGLMARVTLPRRSSVLTILMAISTLNLPMGTGERKLGAVVVKLGWTPRLYTMTGIALL